MFIVYLLFYSALFYYLLLCSILFCSVFFYFILFCKDINKTQSAPRFFPKRAWGNLYYYRFHFFLRSFVILPCSLLHTTSLFIMPCAALYYAMCCSYHAICYHSSCYMFFIAHFQFFRLQL